MSKSDVRRTIGQIEQQKGFTSERKALNALLLHYNDLPWLCLPRKGSWEEDRRGIDIVVPTVDIGDLYLQVKSSHFGVVKFNKRHHRQTIAVVVVKLPESSDIVWINIKNALLGLRKEILKNRGLAEWEE